MMKPERMIAFGGALAIAVAPLSVIAAQTFKQIVDTFFVPFGDLVVALLYALAFLFFLFGVAKFLFSAGNVEAREKGKLAMLWGIIALVVLFGVWGIVKFLLSALMAWA